MSFGTHRVHPIVEVPTEVQNRVLTMLCMSQFCVM